MGSVEIGRASLLFPLQELYVRLSSHTAQARNIGVSAKFKLAIFQCGYNFSSSWVIDIVRFPYYIYVLHLLWIKSKVIRRGKDCAGTEEK